MNVLMSVLMIATVLVSISCAREESPALPYGSYPIPTPPQNNLSEGGISGGGGKGIVCRDDLGNIKSVQMLDLYEAKIVYGLNPSYETAPMDEQIQKALETIPSSQRRLIEIYVDLVKKNMTFTPEGTVLSPINDSFDFIFPAGCAAEQLANFQTNDLILVNGDLWKHLNETDRAALILHEAFYATERIYGSTDSRRSRHVVGKLFDPTTQWVDPMSGIPSDALVCVTHDSPSNMFYAYKSSSSDWVLQFQILGGMKVMSKKTAHIFNDGRKDPFKFSKTMEATPGDDRIGESSSTTSTFRSSFESSDGLVITKSWEAIVDQNGKTLSGFQMEKYYLSWSSGHYPLAKVRDQWINCTVELFGRQQ